MAETKIVVPLAGQDRHTFFVVRISQLLLELLVSLRVRRSRSRAVSSLMLSTLPEGG